MASFMRFAHGLAVVDHASFPALTFSLGHSNHLILSGQPPQAQQRKCPQLPPLWRENQTSSW